MKEALISIKPAFVDKICAGEKTVELRNRRINLESGTRLWLYSTLPSGTLEAFTIVDSVDYDTPNSIWDRYSDRIFLKKYLFDEYTQGCDKVSAIVFSEITKIQPALSLDSMRDYHNNFQPPQFYKWITSESPLAPIFNLIAKNNFKHYELSFVSL